MFAGRINYFLFTALIIAFAPVILLAGSTGKIKGIVIDKETGKPIMGASILLVGTKQGAITDPYGYFLITLVPVETFSVKVSSVLYETLEILGIEVLKDSTTEMNIELKRSEKENENIVRIDADVDNIIKLDSRGIFRPPIPSVDLLSSNPNINNQSEILDSTTKKTPVHNVDSILRSTAGINITAEGEIIIRGGRAGEVKYIVDGPGYSQPTGGAGPMNLGLAPTSEWGMVFGQVIDPATGKPIPDVKVSIKGYPSTAITDDFGYYYFKDVPTGTYTIKVTAHDHFITKEKTIDVIPDNITKVDFELEWALRSQQSMDFTNKVPGKIKGRVTDKKTGDPVPGASVMLVGTRQGAMTDPNGYFLITLVPPGIYTIRATSVSYNTIDIDSVKVNLNQTLELPIKMEKAVTDLGTVIRVRNPNVKLGYKSRPRNGLSHGARFEDLVQFTDIGMIVGRITDKHTNKPIVDASISIGGINK